MSVRLSGIKIHLENDADYLWALTHEGPEERASCLLRPALTFDGCTKHKIL